MLLNQNKYRVKLKGRAGLIYKENDKSMLIDSEMLTGQNFDIVIYYSSIKAWEIPHEKELVSEDDKAKIRENITSALNKLRIDWE